MFNKHNDVKQIHFPKKSKMVLFISPFIVLIVAIQGPRNNEHPPFANVFLSILIEVDVHLENSARNFFFCFLLLGSKVGVLVAVFYLWVCGSWNIPETALIAEAYEQCYLYYYLYMCWCTHMSMNPCLFTSYCQQLVFVSYFSPKLPRKQLSTILRVKPCVIHYHTHSTWILSQNS